MQYLQYYIKALQNYATFTGRARRKEYWMFVLFNCIFSLCAGILDSLISARWISIVYSLAVIIPAFAIEVRRMHDIGKSGKWIFIVLVPIVGPLVLLVWLVTDGEPRTNMYGADPKGRK